MELLVSKVKGKVKNTIKSLKKSKKIYKTFPVMKDEEAKQYLQYL